MQYGPKEILALNLLLVMACSPSRNDPGPTGSCVSAIASEDVTITPGKSNSFHWGYAEIGYNPELAKLVFSGHSKKADALSKGGEKFRCRVFYFEEDDYLAGLTSRHCILQAAVEKVEFFYYNKENKKKNLNLLNDNRSAWERVAKAAVDITNTQDAKVEDYYTGFPSRYLSFNTYNAKIYELASNTTEVSRGIADGKLTEADLPPISTYYSQMRSQTSSEQAAFFRDLCSTDYSINSDPSLGQNICFSISDMSVVHFEKPKDLGEKEQLGQQGKDWLKALNDNSNRVRSFLLEEAVFEASRLCSLVYSSIDECSVGGSIKEIAEAAKEFKNLPISKNNLLTLSNSVFDSRSSRYELTKIRVRYHNKLQESFSDIGARFDKITASKKDSSKFNLAGFYLKEGETKSLMGFVNFSDSLFRSTAQMIKNPNGYFLNLKSNDLVFIEQDSGSVLFYEGLPLAVLSTVDGEASSGGASSVGDISVAVIDDPIDPAVLTASYNQAHNANDVADSAGGTNTDSSTSRSTTQAASSSPDLSDVGEIPSSPGLDNPLDSGGNGINVAVEREKASGRTDSSTPDEPQSIQDQQARVGRPGFSNVVRDGGCP